MANKEEVLAELKKYTGEVPEEVLVHPDPSFPTEVFAVRALYPVTKKGKTKFRQLDFLISWKKETWVTEYPTIEECEFNPPGLGQPYVK